MKSSGRECILTLQCHQVGETAAPGPDADLPLKQKKTFIHCVPSPLARDGRLKKQSYGNNRTKTVFLRQPYCPHRALRLRPRVCSSSAPKPLLTDLCLPLYKEKEQTQLANFSPVNATQHFIRNAVHIPRVKKVLILTKKHPPGLSGGCF